MAEPTHDVVRVVVTGIGAVSAHGTGVDRLWDGVRAGRVAIRPVKNLPMDGYRTVLGGEVQDPATPVHDYGEGFPVREPVLDFALTAAEEAMAGCGLRVGAGAGAASVSPHRWGVVFGSCNGGLVSGERLLRDQLAGRDPDWRGSLLVSPQATAEALSAAFDLRGPVLSVNTACASGAHAIAHAMELIRGGQADAMLVGGADALCEVVFAGFNSLESLAAGPAAPYSRDRDGLSLGEGSGMLVLVRKDVAGVAGAPVLAEVLGYGLSADGHHPTAPHPQGEGAARAITAALAAAAVSADDVGYVNGHGTGTAKNDPAEVKAIRTAFGAAAAQVRLSSTKSTIGHLLGAAGAVEAIVTILALRDQVAPPTAGFTGPDPQCDLDVVPNVAQPVATDVAVSTNFAFAGANACVVLARPDRRSASASRTEEPVVVTGLAALSPAAPGARELWAAYQAGTRCGEREDRLRVDRMTADAAAHIAAHIPARQRRRLDRLGLLAAVACQTALADAGLPSTGPPSTGLPSADRPAHRIGVVLGTGLGPMESMARFTLPLLDSGPALANPAVFPNTVYNMAAGQVAMLLGVIGVTSTVTATHAAGAVALCVARDLLRSGAADAIVCPAVDVLPPAVVRAYARLPLFDAGRADGYTLAEGGFALVLERRSAATARNARIRAELSGYGIASDARGIGQWDRRGGGVERAMRIALDMAGIAPDAVPAVWANAAGLAPVDRPERAAIERVFGPAGPRVEAPKRRLGEPVGAGAHLSTVLALTEWELTGAGGPALVNSSSLGGTHVAIVLAAGRERS
jgi:3-oxoacyl-[acyl-carrier-protein] synthase II